MHLQTRTYAVLPISRSAYDEIRSKLLASGYSHASRQSGSEEHINLDGLMLRAIDPVPSTDAIPPTAPVIDVIRELLAADGWTQQPNSIAWCDGMQIVEIFGE